MGQEKTSSLRISRMSSSDYNYPRLASHSEDNPCLSSRSSISWRICQPRKPLGTSAKRLCRNDYRQCDGKPSMVKECSAMSYTRRPHDGHPRPWTGRHQRPYCYQPNWQPRQRSTPFLPRDSKHMADDDEARINCPQSRKMRRNITPDQLYAIIVSL